VVEGGRRGKGTRWILFAVAHLVDYEGKVFSFLHCNYLMKIPYRQSLVA